MSDLRPHALYRFLDRDGGLLYVGITADPGVRWKTHSKDKPWWSEVATCTVEHFSTRDAVLAAERTAIATECPRYNVVHNGKRPIPAPAPTMQADASYHDYCHGIRVGTVAAFGMADGRCPVGIVKIVHRKFLSIDLYSWLTGYFSGDARRIDTADIRQWRMAQRMDPATAERTGLVLRPGDVVWDMDPLADFQTQWTEWVDLTAGVR